MKTLNHKRTLIFYSNYRDKHSGTIRNVVRFISPTGECQVISESMSLSLDGETFSCFSVLYNGLDTRFAPTIGFNYENFSHKFSNSIDTVKAMKKFDRLNKAKTVFIGYAD